MKRAASGQGCRRRLWTWPQIGSSQDSDDLKGTDEAPESPVKALSGAAAAGTAPAPPSYLLASSPSSVQAADSDRKVVQSPIIDGALFLEGRRKARVLFQGQPISSRAATAGEAGEHQRVQHGSLMMPAACQQQRTNVIPSARFLHPCTQCCIV